MFDENHYLPKKFKNLHNSLIQNFYPYEDQKIIINDAWKREGFGSGLSVVIDGGNFFDKAGINFSQIIGQKLPQSSTGSNSNEDEPFFATGVSLVFHPKNPQLPTSHLNVRFFQTFSAETPKAYWFGGGCDLTPYVLYEEDCVDWHKNAKKVAGESYDEWKQACDKYFFLDHRKEHRGIGGLFYEKQQFKNLDEGLDISSKIVKGFTDAYKTIIERRCQMKFTKRQKEFQRYRRGRYVEFNLLQDRGTLFGLQSNGRIESILMSLPNDVSWRYKFDETLTQDELRLVNLIKKPKKWA